MDQTSRHAAANAVAWGSDRIADLLRSLNTPYLALTPGSSFRGLHDSLINHLGNERPEHILAIHEESAVAIAHGYAKVTGKPLAVALHANLGLMHASMAIFNAWCDRAPMLIFGAVGPMDAALRRPYVDWLHTATDLAALIRPYIKWDNQPASIPAAVEAIIRAQQISRTAPQGPVYICLDQTLQEAETPTRDPLPNMRRFEAPRSPAPDRASITEIAQRLSSAKRPLALIGRVSAKRPAWDRRVAFAEAYGLHVLTDLKVGAKFPTRHPLHAASPGLSPSADALALIRNADLILSLDWIDLGGTLYQAFGKPWPEVTVVQCSLDQYSHNGWSMDHQALPAADISLLTDPDRLTELLLAEAEACGISAAPPAGASWAAARPARSAGEIGIEDLARVVIATLVEDRPSYLRLPIGWPGALCDFDDPLDYIGYDGAGGIGSGPGMSVGSALGLRGTDRLPVAVLGDGDFLMGATAIWSAVHHRIPLLVIVANNRSFFNDELHQERMAKMRGRPVENRGVGIQIDDPAPDLAMIARGQGCVAFGPVSDIADLSDTLRNAVKHVREGRVAFIDAHVRREYGRGIPAQVLRTTDQ
ncbi:thiamine pyrophosphate-binding protein [Terrarubrum flagellatum]|uniref:thiamine pyrophosphate-binding protein n=1 Tax=Terrirubrum flagellatum TaxID=2895980 RepID=UPI00314551DB